MAIEVSNAGTSQRAKTWQSVKKSAPMIVGFVNELINHHTREGLFNIQTDRWLMQGAKACWQAYFVVR